jgi:DNA repair ATPase RecN
MKGTEISKEFDTLRERLKNCKDDIDYIDGRLAELETMYETFGETGAQLLKRSKDISDKKWDLDEFLKGKRLASDQTENSKKVAEAADELERALTVGLNLAIIDSINALNRFEDLSVACHDTQEAMIEYIDYVNGKEDK